jgi:transcriptional regulator with XRE-family HTH domain
MASAPDSPLGGYIRRQRELQKLSLRQLADLVGISNPSLSQIERGLREPSEKVLDAIARNLELSTRASTSRARAVAVRRRTTERNRPWWRRFAPIPI